jgi:hypothetical protein
MSLVKTVVKESLPLSVQAKIYEESGQFVVRRFVRTDLHSSSTHKTLHEAEAVASQWVGGITTLNG